MQSRSRKHLVHVRPIKVAKGTKKRKHHGDNRNDEAIQNTISETTRGSRWQNALDMVTQREQKGFSVPAPLALSAAARGACWSIVLGLMGNKLQECSGRASIREATAACGKGGWGRAVGMLQKLQLLGIELTEECFNTLSSICQKASRRGGKDSWMCSVKCLEMASANSLEASVIAHNTVMATLGQSLLWYRSFSALSKMRIRMLSPDDFSINTLATACEKKFRWEAAVSVVWKFSSSLGIQADVIGQNAVMSACGSNGQWQWASTVLGSLGNEGLRATQISIAATASACEKANLWLWPMELLRSKGMTGPVLYGAALDALEKCGLWKETTEILGAMKRSSLHNMDAQATSAAISACSKGDWRQTLSLTVEVINQSPDAMSTEAWNACIRGCVPHCPTDTLLTWMDESRCEPDMLSYAIVLDGCRQHIISGTQFQLVTKVRTEGLRVLWRLCEKISIIFAFESLIDSSIIKN